MALARGLSLIVFTAILGALGSCQSLDDLDREAYRRACDNLGIQRGAPTYDQCMLQQQALDNEDDQRFLDREVAKGAL